MPTYSVLRIVSWRYNLERDLVISDQTRGRIHLDLGISYNNYIFLEEVGKQCQCSDSEIVLAT